MATPQFLANDLGRADANAKLVRHSAQGTTTRMGSSSFGISSGDVSFGLVAQGVGNAAWHRHKNGVERPTPFGLETVTTNPTKVEQFLTVGRHEGAKKTWRWKFVGMPSNLTPRVGTDGYVAFLVGAGAVKQLSQDAFIAPPAILDAHGTVIPQKYLRWSVSFAGGHWWLKLHVNDSKLATPYVVDPIAIRGTATSNSQNNGTTLVLTAPTGVVANDVMIAQVTTRNNAAISNTAGLAFTQIGTTVTNTVNLEQAIWRRVATASEGGSTTTFSWTGSVDATGGIIAYSGVNPTTPIDASTSNFGTTSGTAGTSPCSGTCTATASAVTTSQPGDEILAFYGSRGTSNSTGVTLTQDGSQNVSQQYTVVSGSGSKLVHAVSTGSAGSTPQAVAGSTGNFTATLNLGGTPWITHTVALTPLQFDGSGTVSANRTNIAASSTGNTVQFTYTAAQGGLSAGAVTVAVPTGWTAPVTTNAIGCTTASAGTLSVSGQTITVSGLTLSQGNTLTITYGATSGGSCTVSDGATATGTTGAATWTVQSKATAGGTLTTLTDGSSPSITVRAANGSGTNAVSPTTATAGTSNNTLTFTYTAATGGTSNGEVDVTVPSGWTAPTTSNAAGCVTASTGSVAVSGATIKVTGVSLSGGGTMTITYGATSGGSCGAGDTATAPTSVQTSTFTTSEKSTNNSNDTLVNIGSSPSVSVNAAAQSAYRISAASSTPTAGATDVLTIRAVDQFGNTVTGVSGDKSLTFSGLGTSPGGTVPTVTNKTGSAVNEGTATTVTFTNGVSSAGGTLVAYKAEGPVTLATSDGTFSSSGSGGTGASLTVSPATANATQSTLTPVSSSITANGSATQVLTVQAKDQFGNNLTTGGSTVTITKLSGTGTIGSVTDNGNGTYTATVTAPTATGSGVFVATLGGNPVKSGTGSQTQATVTYVPGAADATQSTLTPTSASITANGSATQVLTVQAKDANGNNETSGGATVTITKLSGTGSIGSVTDNGNGAYTATVTAPTATGSGVFVATLGGNPVKSGTGSQTQATVTYVPGAADATQSTLTPTSSSITANGSATQVLTVQAKDANGNNLTAGGSTVTITQQSGTGSIGSVTDNGDGSYTATVTAPTATGSGVFVATLGGQPVKSGTGSQTQATVTYVPGAGAGAQSSISANPHSITADGSSTSTVTVTVDDAYGNPTAGGDAVVLHTDLGSLGSVTDNGDGTYTATLTSSTTVGTAHITGTVNSETIATTDAVNFVGMFTKSSDVQIDGVPAVGTTLTITNAVFSPTASTRTQQWELCDGSGNGCANIGGATGKTYTPVATDVGSTLKIVQTVSRAGYDDASSTSTASAIIINGDFATTTAVAINGTPTVDTQATITAGSYSPTPTSSAYQWQLCDVSGNNCSNIGGATTDTYTPVPSDAGSTLRVVETVSKTGYNDGSSTSDRATVTTASTVTNTPVAVNGTPTVGTPTTLTPGTYTPSPTGRSYQWQKCDSSGTPASCANISGATNSTYTPGAGAVGSTLRVIETVTKTGYSNGSSTSTASALVVNGNFATNTAVSVNGTPTVAAATTLTAGSYTPAPASSSYQWQLCDSSGTPASCGNIGGATSSTYTPVATDVGSTLRVVETVSKSGYNSGGSTSAASPVVVNASFTTTTAVSINGTPTQGTATTLTPGTYTPTPTGQTYQWRLCDSTGANCANIGGATNATYTPVSGDVGSTLRVVETVTKPGYNARSSTSSAVAVVGIFSTNTAVAINGTPTVGTMSTMTGGTYTPSPTARSYQWMRCTSTTLASCANISGATNNAYTPVAGDVGKFLRVVETVTRASYVNGGSTSAASAAVVNGTFVMNTQVAVFGFPRQGTASTITQGSYTPTPTSRTYQWMRCTSTTLASCTNISGATTNTYTPVAADVGKRLRVIETVSKAGFDNLSVTSQASAAVTT